MKRPLLGVWSSAMWLAQEHGLAVFPLRTFQKTPLSGSRGCLDASTHPEQIGEWADRYPKANYGILCGGWTRLLVIDFDRLDALVELTEQYGIRPPTPTVATPKPGRHEYYALPAGVSLGNSASRLLDGVDTRCHHGYTVGPCSTLADGRAYATLPDFSFADIDIAPLPESILAALSAPTATIPRTQTTTSPARQHDGDITRRVAAYLRRMPSLANGQGRNDAAWRLAAFVIHDCSGTLDDARVAVDVWNARNREPLAAARLAVIVENAQRHGARRDAA